MADLEWADITRHSHEFLRRAREEQVAHKTPVASSSMPAVSTAGCASSPEVPLTGSFGAREQGAAAAAAAGRTSSGPEGRECTYATPRDVAAGPTAAGGCRPGHVH